MQTEISRSIYQAIRAAILLKQPIAITYKDGTDRLLCPHVLGLNREGRPQGLFYQFGGASNSGLGPDGAPRNWRCIPIEDIHGVQPLSDTLWHTAPNHTRPQTCVWDIDVSVEWG